MAIAIALNTKSTCAEGYRLFYEKDLAPWDGFANVPLVALLYQRE
jgi:hypothetical protein